MPTALRWCAKKGLQFYTICTSVGINEAIMRALKGNINRKGEHTYHAPGGQWYDQTKIDPAKGEPWFCTEEEARAAGWRPAKQ